MWEGDCSGAVERCWVRVAVVVAVVDGDAVDYLNVAVVGVDIHHHHHDVERDSVVVVAVA